MIDSLEKPLMLGKIEDRGMSLCVCGMSLCVCVSVCLTSVCMCVLCVWYMVRGVCFSSVRRGSGWRPALAGFLEGSFPVLPGGWARSCLRRCQGGV